MSGRIGNLYAQLDEYADAAAAYAEAAELWTSVGEEIRLLDGMLREGQMYQELGATDAAIDTYVAILPRLSGSSVETRADLLSALGKLYASQRNYVEAQTYYQSSLDLWAELGDTEQQITTLEMKGLSYQEQGDDLRGVLTCMRRRCLCCRA